MIGSNLTHRGMVEWSPVRVRAPRAGGACAQSARKTIGLVLGSLLGIWRQVSGLSRKAYSGLPAHTCFPRGTFASIEQG
jgi:hypothetical protein